MGYCSKRTRHRINQSLNEVPDSGSWHAGGVFTLPPGNAVADLLHRKSLNQYTDVAGLARARKSSGRKRGTRIVANPATIIRYGVALREGREERAGRASLWIAFFAQLATKVLERKLACDDTSSGLICIG